MGEIVRCRFDLVDTHTHSTTAIELTNPLGQLEARTTADVVSVLAEAESSARAGRHVSGFVAYEAAPAFDDALTVNAPRPATAVVDLPLAWFGVFADRRAAAPLTRRIPHPSTGRPDAPPDGQALQSAGAGPWTSEIGPAEHHSGVERIRSAIAAGDSYLVNFTTRFRRPWPLGEDPFGLYRQLVAGHAGGLHGFIETTEWAVASGSPELFFELSSGQLTTRPMKGTSARGRSEAEDRHRAEALATSEKEQAENLMVVDLLRNDLGRVAVTGTVSVPGLWEVERHPTAWQLTSTVTATARPGVGVVEVFRALFPCGSVTGAPKVTTMGIIRDLEPSPRGVYCGAIGLIEPDPMSAPGVRARFSVAIRTAVVDKLRMVAEYGSGGGITWDSSAEAEWDEIMVKTSALTGPAAHEGGDAFLFETMRADPPSAESPVPRVKSLAAHLNRLTSSAEHFGLSVPSGCKEAVTREADGLVSPSRLRLTLHLDGQLTIESTDLGEEPTGVQLLGIDDVPVDSSDATLFHKTTDRRRYEERARRHPDLDDVVLVNERGEVTETTRANLCALIDGRWWTPALDCGLLPGVERSRLLAAGRLAERVITIEQLERADEVATVSSLRGWRPARMGHLQG